MSVLSAPARGQSVKVVLRISLFVLAGRLVSGCRVDLLGWSSWLRVSQLAWDTPDETIRLSVQSVATYNHYYVSQYVTALVSCVIRQLCAAL